METACKGIWIPTEIWQNEDLTVTEKLFIVKINALDGEKGCYASNRYFSEFFKLSKSRCSAVIKNLKDKGYIAIHYAYEEGKKAIERRVIKVKKAVCSMVKIAKNLSKTKEILNDKRKEIENEIECLELSGGKSRIRRKRNREENLVDIDAIEETKELSIDNIEEDGEKIRELEIDSIEDCVEENKELEIKRIEDDLEGIRGSEKESIEEDIEEINQLGIENIEESNINLDENEVDQGVILVNIFKEEITVENIKFSGSENQSKTNKKIDKKNNNKIIYEEIIDYLNLKCNKNFKYTTGKTIRCINARMREGNTINDFKKVIDKKYDEWANTTMKVYLRPETLFGTKFERYLTEDVKERENHFKKSNWTGGQAYGKQFKNVRNSGEIKETEERTRFGNITPLTAEEIERAKRELF